MAGIGVVGGDLDDVVVTAPIGSNGASPAETGLERLLGSEEPILLSRLDRTVRVNQDGELRKVHLTPIEFNLLEYLMRNAGRVVPLDEISRKVLGYDQHDRGSQDSIRGYIKDIRRKLGQEGMEHIENVHGVGYKFISAQKHAADEIPLGSEESLLLYPSSRVVYVNQDGQRREVHLTLTEFSLLEYLMRNAGRVVPRDEISRKVLRFAHIDG